MTEKKKLAETTIRVYAETKEKLKKLKIGNEGDAVVLARVLEENRQLKEEKKQLYEILSNINVPTVRVNTFTEIIENIINGTANDKLQVLKEIFNSSILTREPIEVKEAIQILKNEYKENNIPTVLVDFESYVNDFH